MGFRGVMLGQKEEKVVVTFHTTAEAMATEKRCKEQNAPGRLIPVPRVLSAGCGLAWCAPADAQPVLEALFVKEGIVYDKMTRLML